MTSIKISLATHIQSKEVVAGVHLLEMKTPVADVVTIAGSLWGGPVFNPQNNRVLAQMMAVMLDQGTIDMDKFTISEKLEEIGAQITFSPVQYYLRFSARCLKGDVPLVIKLLADQLRNPLFPEEDLETMKTNQIGDLLRSKEETEVIATSRFLQEIYPKEHPNYVVPIDEQIDHIRKLSRSDLQDFHARSLGRGNLTIVAVGDLDDTVLEKAILDGFGSWHESGLSFAKAGSSGARDIKEARKVVATMQDKTSVDIMIGQPIGIDRDHKDFLPLKVGHYILGGNFSARLMSTVRDQAGLTYGIRSAVAGTDRTDGYWYVWGTFAPELVERGRSAAAEQIEQWINAGVTEEELEAKKTTIIGSYQVSFSTTGGIATQILINRERGKEVSYLDDFPKEIAALSRKDVNNAIRSYCNMENILFVAAGSINEKWEPLN